MRVGFKRLETDAQIPTKATKGAAGYDCYIPKTQNPLMPGETRIIPLGFSVEVPDGYELQIRARSGLASRGIIVSNGVGMVDSDYRNEVGVILTNLSGMIQPLNKGDRICQVKLAAAPLIFWDAVDELPETEREGGYGSTGGVSEKVV